MSATTHSGLKLGESLLILFMIGFNSLATSSAQAVVPAAAEHLAQSYLEGKWKPNAKANPEFYGVAGVDVSHATLAPRFPEYIMRGERVERYLVSIEVDPRQYAAITRYSFPIVVDAECVGSIIVQRNRDENNKGFDESSGDYFFFAVSFRDNPVDDYLLNLRARAGAESEVIWLQIVGSNVTARFLVKPPGGELLSAPQGEELVPVAEDAKRLKAEIRAGLKVRKQLEAKQE
jgi:hypothetical protein